MINIRDERKRIKFIIMKIEKMTKCFRNNRERACKTRIKIKKIKTKVREIRKRSRETKIETK